MSQDSAGDVGTAEQDDPDVARAATSTAHLTGSFWGAADAWVETQVQRTLTQTPRVLFTA